MTGWTLRKAIADHVDMAGSVLHTDEGSHYRSIGKEFSAHLTVNHSDGKYVGKRGQSTNRAENFFSQLKRSIDGTHHHVSHQHLGRYLGEFDFRYSYGKETDAVRFARLMGQTGGRRLTYRRLIAGVRAF